MTSVRMLLKTILLIMLFLSMDVTLVWAWTTSIPSNNENSLKAKNVYRYFGYGSNVLPSTMKALRQISVQECVAAVLPNYELVFYGSASSSSSSNWEMKKKKGLLVETSAAFVEPCSDENNRRSAVVHGVLYTLSEEDFVKVGRTEGVPWVYRWQSCWVYPYCGDGVSAGYDALQNTDPVEAYTLVAAPTQPITFLFSPSKPPRAQAPPSASYLGLIQEGAKLWKFDRAYQEYLDSIEVATNLLGISEGVSELVLRWAERASGIERTYKIRVFDTPNLSET
jgi:hypothetical protein